MKLLLSIFRRHARRHPRLAAWTAGLVALHTALWIFEPLYSSYAIDLLLGAKDGGAVPYRWIFGVWAVFFVVLSIVQALEKYATWQMDNTLVVDRREEVYRHVLALDIAFHTKQKSGEVMKILDEGADNAMELQRQLLFELLPSGVAALTFLAISVGIHPLLAGILFAMLLAYVGVVVVGLKRTAALQDKVNRLWVRGIGRGFDAITNIFSVHANAQAGREMRTMEGADAEAHRTQLKVNYRWALIESLNFFMMTRILLISVGILLYTSGDLTLGQLYFFQFSFFRVLTPFEMLAGLLPRWNRRVGKVRLSEQILRTPVRVRSLPGARKLTELRGEVRFEAVCFGYPRTERFLLDDEDDLPPPGVTPPPPAEREPEDELPAYPQHDASGAEDARMPRSGDAPSETGACGTGDGRHAGEVLHGISLSVSEGERIAFVGHSGAGKSTLASLLLRFYDVSKGRILVDGEDLRELDLDWWRAQVGLVLQENMMFNDSILENIRYARPDATRDEVVEAARRAAAHEFIGRLPDGYDTIIGDRGIRLSGGQRQRVAIARAILKRPRIVVLDEATSALDSVTERLVQEGIRELVADRTSFIIAHRLSTVRTVDRIAVLDRGSLVAIAPHNELLRTCAIYKEMVELQSHGMLAE